MLVFFTMPWGRDVESQMAGIARQHGCKLPRDAEFYSKFLGNRMAGGNHFRQTLCATHFLDANGILSLDTKGKRLHKSREEYTSFSLLNCKLVRWSRWLHKDMRWPAASPSLSQAMRSRLNRGYRSCLLLARFRVRISAKRWIVL
jgi:hypothetical protein